MTCHFHGDKRQEGKIPQHPKAERLNDVRRLSERNLAHEFPVHLRLATRDVKEKPSASKYSFTPSHLSLRRHCRQAGEYLARYWFGLLVR
jgi:hypothetical protein